MLGEKTMYIIMALLFPSLRNCVYEEILVITKEDGVVVVNLRSVAWPFLVEI